MEEKMKEIRKRNKEALTLVGDVQSLLEENLNCVRNSLTLINLAAFLVEDNLQFVTEIDEMLDAIALLKEALNLESTNTNGYALLVIIYLHFEEYDAARKYYTFYQEHLKGTDKLAGLVEILLKEKSKEAPDLSVLFNELSHESKGIDFINYKVGLQLLMERGDKENFKYYLDAVPKNCLYGTDHSLDYLFHTLDEVADFYAGLGDEEKALFYYDQQLKEDDNVLDFLCESDRIRVKNHLYLMKNIKGEDAFWSLAEKVFDKLKEDSKQLYFTFDDLYTDREGIREELEEHYERLMKLVTFNDWLDSLMKETDYTYQMTLRPCEIYVLAYDCFYLECPIH